MDLLPVHIAVLTIADDAASADRATAQAIRERAANAGHVIVEDEVAKDNEASIRDQLVRWIAEPNIDVVIVAAGIDSEAASAALAPLVMQTLPGFTDLFRWLTFQEIGASAMLSAAEAAQCESTFVFVLPAHEAAVRAAMEKLILPQLDLRTKPKNLVSQMPRLKDEAKRLLAAQQAVPTPIVTEKTVGGSGVMPKPPARPKTTTNTIARKQPDPPTKPIDLAKLEKQIALSNVNDAQTKEIALDVHHAETKVVDMSAHQAKTKVVDMSRLPRVPPGADENAHEETDTLTFDTPPAGADRFPAYRSAAPIGVVKSTPLPSIPKPGAASESKAPAPTLAKPPPALSTPSFSTPIARTPPVRQPAATPPSATSVPGSPPASPRASSPASLTDTPPVAVPIIRPRSAQSPASSPARAQSPSPAAAAPMPISPAADAATPSSTSSPVAAAPSSTSTATPTPASTRAVTPAPTAAASATTPEPAAPARAATPAPSAPAASSAAASGSAAPSSSASAAGSGAAAAPAAPAPEAAASPAAATRAALDTATPPPLPAVPAAASRPVRDESPAISLSEPIPRLSDSQIEEVAELSDDAIEPEESAAPPPAPAVTPPPARKPTQPPPVRAPTQPPPADPLAAVSARPLGDVDLPQGDFVYPIKKSGAGLFLKLLLAAAALAGGFFAFIKLYPQATSTQTAAVTPEPVPSAPVEAAPAPTEPEPAPADETSEPEPAEPEPAPSEPVASATSRRRTEKPTTRAQSRAPKDSAVVKPANPTDEVAAGDDKGKGGGETSQPAPASPDCDEVSCVMTKYDRPCCERYRPADSFRPRTQIPDELDKPMVKAGVETVKPRIIACGEKHGVKGTVRVSVTVADVGTVKAVSVVESPDPALGECVAAAMRNAKFGKSAKGGEFVYPFVF